MNIFLTPVVIIKREFVVVLVSTIFISVSVLPNVAASPWSDCHGIDPFTEEAKLVESYTDSEYYAFYFENWEKTKIIDDSLKVADIWYFSGHGGEEPGVWNYLVAGNGDYIYPHDIPDLHGQVEFESMRFAYSSACHSGETGYFSDSLAYAFQREGVKSYMGWEKTVFSGTSYQYTDRFYHYTIDNELSVYDAKNVAVMDVPDAQGNIKVFGDDVSLIP